MVFPVNSSNLVVTATATAVFSVLDFLLHLSNATREDYDSYVSNSSLASDTYDEYYNNAELFQQSNVRKSSAALTISSPFIDISKKTNRLGAEIISNNDSLASVQSPRMAALTSQIDYYSQITAATTPYVIAELVKNITAPQHQQQHLCNVSGDQSSWSPWERSMLFGCGLLVAFSVALLNVCVIFTFIKCAEIRIAPQHLYILNLAICDFCVGVNSLPGVTIYFVNMCWPFSVPLCQVMTSVDWITSTETGVSMCLIAYDRLRLVRLGALYSQRENRRVVITKIVCSWVLVIVLLSPGILMPHYTGASANDHGDCVNEIYQIEKLGTVLTTITGILPPLALVLIYYGVYSEMRANRRFNSEREAQRQRRAARGMYFLCVIFLISWVPSTLHELIMSLIHSTPALKVFNLNTYAEFRLLTFFKFWIYLNSLVNPFLYAFAFRAIRAAMEKTFLSASCYRKLDQRRSLRQQQQYSYGTRNIIKLIPAAAAPAFVDDEEGSIQTIRDWTILPIKPARPSMIRRRTPSRLAKSFSEEETVGKSQSSPEIIKTAEIGMDELKKNSGLPHKRPRSRRQRTNLIKLSRTETALPSVRKKIKFCSATASSGSCSSNSCGKSIAGSIGNGSITNNKSRIITLAAIQYSTIIVSPNNSTHCCPAAEAVMV